MVLKAFIIKIFKILYKFYSRKKNLYFSIEVQLADHCNLNCVGCSHFSPVADRNFLNVASYRMDCEKFAELAKKYVNEIRLMGGEPLLNKDITEIIKITRKNFDKCTIKIVTNGILLDRMESDFWNSCKMNNVTITITTYPLNLDVKKICELALQYGVNIDFYGNNVTKFRKDVYDSEGMQDKKETYKKCAKSGCHHLYEGRFYMCPMPAYIKYVNKYFSKNFEVSMDDYIDIYQVKNIKALMEYLRKPIPFCRYCNLNASYNIAWSISKKEISEWM